MLELLRGGILWNLLNLLNKSPTLQLQKGLGYFKQNGRFDMKLLNL